MSREEAHRLWRQFANPDYMDLLEALDFGRCFVRASGTRLYDDAGREYTDFLAGFGVHNIGHNHPRVVNALHEALDSQMPSMLNADAPLMAGRLAARLTALTHSSLCRASFANSGAEAADMAIKAARAATGRGLIVSCAGGYHGLSVGTLPLLGRAEFAWPFGATGADATQIPFDDLQALEEVCARRQPAAFIVEPIQGEGGIRVASGGYLREAGRICRRHGCLLVIDEIQTGLGRTGVLFATDFAEVVPDILLLGKALSGGLVPVSAAMMTADVWARAFGGPERCRMNASTFAGGHLAMTAALEVLAVLVDEGLAARAKKLGAVLLQELGGLAARHTVIKEVRGSGLLIGVEFEAPEGLLAKAVPAWAREGLFAHVIAARLLKDYGMLTTVCSLAPAVLRVEPPLVISADEAGTFVAALDRVLADIPSYNSAVWSALWQRLSKGAR